MVELQGQLQGALKEKKPHLMPYVSLLMKVKHG